MNQQKKTLKEIQDNAEEVIRTGRMLEEMKKTEGWKWFSRYVQAHIEQERRALDAPVKNTEEAFTQNYLKGSVNGKAWLLGVLETIIAEAKEMSRPQEKQEAPAPGKPIPPATETKQ